MQIKSVQNIIRSNFKYKNNPINFGIKYDTNTQKGDIVELSQKLGVDPDEVVTSKRYYMGNHEFNQNS